MEGLWVISQIQVPLLTGCATLGKSNHSSDPNFLISKIIILAASKGCYKDERRECISKICEKVVKFISVNVNKGQVPCPPSELQISVPFSG